MILGEQQNKVIAAGSDNIYKRPCDQWEQGPVEEKQGAG